MEPIGQTLMKRGLGLNWIIALLISLFSPKIMQADSALLNLME